MYRHLSLTENLLSIMNYICTAISHWLRTYSVSWITYVPPSLIDWELTQYHELHIYRHLSLTENLLSIMNYICTAISHWLRTYSVSWITYVPPSLIDWELTQYHELHMYRHLSLTENSLSNINNVCNAMSHWLRTYSVILITYVMPCLIDWELTQYHELHMYRHLSLTENLLSIMNYICTAISHWLRTHSVILMTYVMPCLIDWELTQYHELHMYRHLSLTENSLSIMNYICTAISHWLRTYSVSWITYVPPSLIDWELTQ